LFLWQEKEYGGKERHVHHKRFLGLDVELSGCEKVHINAVFPF
jgi:hypothetical protein